MGDPKISLMIYGTRLSTSGWEPLVMLNNPPFPTLENMGVAGVGENPTYYTFRIDQKYTQYTLVYNPKYIKAHVAQRAGALKVSISIPKGYKLDGGPSPYNVFIDIQRALETHALTPIIGKAGAFEFKATFPADDVFNRVLDSFKLVETKMPHRPMSSVSDKVGMIIVDEYLEDILFKDIQYPEFSTYKEIAVVRSGESDNIIKNLEIPRKAKYEIIVNKSKATALFKSYNYGYDDSIDIDTVSYYGYDKEAYEGQRIKFTINEALSGKYSRLLQVDKERECVCVTIPEPKIRKKTYNIVVTGVNNPNVIKHLKAYVNKKERAISSSNTIELVGKEITGSMIDVKADGKEYENAGKIAQEEDNIIVPIKEAPKPKEEKAPGKNKTIEFRLILEDPNDINDYNKRFKVCFYNNDISFTYNRPFNKLKGGKGYYVDITIPMEWPDYYCVSLRTDSVKTSSNQHGGYKIGPDTKDIIIKKDDTDKLSWRDKMSKSTKSLLQAMICLIVLAVVALVSIWVYSNSVVNKEEPQVQQKVIPVSDKHDDEIAAQITTYRSRLLDPKITFAEIRNIDKWLSQNSLKLNDQNGGQELRDKVNAYLELLKYLELPYDRNVINIQKVVRDNRKYINECHFQYLQNVWSLEQNSNNSQIWLNSDQIKVVNKALQEPRQYYSFKDIPSSKNIINDVSDNTNRNKHKYSETTEEWRD